MTNFVLHVGDCREVLAGMPDACVDSVVTDPPYEIGFMGKGWDNAGVAFDPALWAEVLRVLKPGGHLLAFGGTRTYHRMAVAIEDAGFEIRDSLHWVYGSGFPKSMNVGKAIDKAAGAERDVIGTRKLGGNAAQSTKEKGGTYASNTNSIGVTPIDVPITAPATPEAERWEGWGTALKPAHEPIVVARKPLSGTVAANVLEHGTGALNIDGCRVGMSDIDREATNNRSGQGQTTGDVAYGKGLGRPEGDLFTAAPGGRWPANLVLTHHYECRQTGTTSETVGGGAAGTSGFAAGYETGDGFVGRDVPTVVWDCHPECPIAVMDAQSGTRRSAGDYPSDSNTEGMFGSRIQGQLYADSGGASRFFQQTVWDADLDGPSFLYVAKPSKKERNAGLDGLPEVEWREGAKNSTPRSGQIYEQNGRLGGPRQNFHPTVKPVALMRYLVRLVTPPGGTVLEPFAGSGTTMVAAILEGFQSIGIEMTADYLPIIEGRVAWAQEQAAAQQVVVAPPDDQPTLFD